VSLLVPSHDKPWTWSDPEGSSTAWTCVPRAAVEWFASLNLNPSPKRNDKSFKNYFFPSITWAFFVISVFYALDLCASSYGQIRLISTWRLLILDSFYKSLSLCTITFFGAVTPIRDWSPFTLDDFDLMLLSDYIGFDFTGRVRMRYYSLPVWLFKTKFYIFKPIKSR